MARHGKRLTAGLIAAFVIGSLLVAGSTYLGRTSDAVDNVRVVEDPEPPERWAINAAYGRGALSNLQAALDEIDAANATEARKGVAVAQSLLGRIEREAPPAKDDLVLVHSEVRVLGDADPGNAVQAMLESLRGRTDMSDHDAIIAALESLKVPLAYTRVDLPLSETVALVDETLRALDARDALLARAKLMQIGEALRIDTVRLGIESHRIGAGDIPDAS